MQETHDQQKLSDLERSLREALATTERLMERLETLEGDWEEMKKKVSEASRDAAAARTDALTYAAAMHNLYRELDNAKKRIHALENKNPVSLPEEHRQEEPPSNS